MDLQLAVRGAQKSIGLSGAKILALDLRESVPPKTHPKTLKRQVTGAHLAPQALHYSPIWHAIHVSLEVKLPSLRDLCCLPLTQSNTCPKCHV